MNEKESESFIERLIVIDVLSVIEYVVKLVTNFFDNSTKVINLNMTNFFILNFHF